MPPGSPHEPDQELLARQLLQRLGLRADPQVLEALEAHARAVDPRHPPGVVYARYQQEPPGSRVLGDLTERLAVLESSFFRHPAQFAALERTALPSLRRSGRSGARVLSAGCARGEEAYSLAISCERAWPGGAHRVFGLDQSAEALQLAALGHYRDWSLRGVDPASLSPWLSRTEGLWIATPALRSLVQFSRGNLLAIPDAVRRAAPFDVIFCRNVLIYCVGEAGRQALSNLAALLGPEGLLFVGPAEHDFCADMGLLPLDVGGAYAYRQGPASERPAPTLRQPASAPPPPRAYPPGPPGPTPLPDLRYEQRLEEGRSARDGGAHEEALRAFDEAIRLHPERSEAYFEQATLLAERGLLPAARELLERVLLLNAGFLPAMVLLARVHLGEGQPARARDLLLQVLAALGELRPGTPLAGWPAMTAGALRKSCERLLETLAPGRPEEAL